MDYRSGLRTGFCVLMLLAGSARSQDNKSIRIYPGFGIAPAIGRLGAESDLGYSGTFGVGYKPSPVTPSQVELMFRATYAWFPARDGIDSEFVYLLVGVHLRLNQILNQTPNVYLTGGGGFAGTKLKASNGSDGGARTAGFREGNPYLAVGIGLESGRLVLEGQIINVFGTRIKNYTWLPFTIGIRI